MDINQFAVYQLKNIPENREIRFRSSKMLQEKKIQIRYEAYEEVYLGYMQPADTPENIRSRLDKQLPRTFKGHSISVSDVLVLNKEGVVTSYYVEKGGFTVIAGFIRNSSSGAIVSFGTMDFHIEGKEGSWHAFDSIVVNGKQFFLMEHEKHGREVAWTVVDEAGKLIVDSTYVGFDQPVLKQIKEYLNPSQSVMEADIQEQSLGNNKGKPSLENWQKYMENGEYLRSSEIEEEQNYNMIDGRRNNMSPKNKKGRTSVLKKLRQKQVEIARRSGKAAPQMAEEEDMERRQK
ncbi:DUF4316 domain-containing protein [Lachnospiraceae bacterium MD308]|nr:DUF4316 domain-containing protein [Lachnospiraceae bacterium MD308]